MKSTKEKIERVTCISGRDGRGLIVIHGLYVCRDIWVTDRNLLSEQEDEDQGQGRKTKKKWKRKGFKLGTQVGRFEVLSVWSSINFVGLRNSTLYILYDFRMQFFFNFKNVFTLQNNNAFLNYFLWMFKIIYRKSYQFMIQ